MLALAIEFSRCSRARTLKAEQCARRRCSALAVAFHSPSEIRWGRTNGWRMLASPTGASASTWSLPVRLHAESARDGHERFVSRSAKRLLRKEVIQPQLPLRLPCYDFTPIASPTFDGSLHKG